MNELHQAQIHHRKPSHDLYDPVSIHKADLCRASKELLEAIAIVTLGIAKTILSSPRRTLFKSLKGSRKKVIALCFESCQIWFLYSLLTKLGKDYCANKTCNDLKAASVVCVFQIDIEEVAFEGNGSECTSAEQEINLRAEELEGQGNTCNATEGGRAEESEGQGNTSSAPEGGGVESRKSAMKRLRALLSKLRLSQGRRKKK